MLAGTYNSWLVLASVFVAVLASFTALNMVGRIAEARGAAAMWWLAGGSAAMGMGIWSMHFIGMLAFQLPVPMDYDPGLTFVSLLLAIASSAFALWQVCQPELSWRRLCAGALLMGAGISSMHYTGMATMRMRPGIEYSPSLVLLSVAIAVLTSGTGLWVGFHLQRRAPENMLMRAGAAMVLGLAIAGMHYTGMSAARFPIGSACTMVQHGLSAAWMACLVIVSTMAVLFIALIISTLDHRMHLRTATLASSLATANEELRFLALHDSLTKLPNRTLLDDRLDHEIRKSKRSGNSFCVLSLDIDGLREINDAFGHETGDLLLLQVAERIRRALRSQDTLARLEGDEFVLLAEARESGNAAQLAEKMMSILQPPFVLAGQACQITVSIGIAMCSGGSTSRETLLKNADAAMYHAKALGRNTYCFFEASMNRDAQKQVQVFHDLRLALDRHELVLYYQPKFDAQSGEMIGAEALIRWNHPVRGLVPPGEFIPLAEKIGLILPIGKWTIEEACRQMREWRSFGHGSWPVAVNLSAIQFNHPGLIEIVELNLRRHFLDPGALVLEITESTAMGNPDASLAILGKLHRMGVRISIDDFGTGYSSLLYLKRLPAAELKIDRGFVRDLAHDTGDAAIISAIVAIGRSLHLDVVAEGVETVIQQQFLTRLGCTSLQGFLLGRPMPPGQFIAAMDQARSAWKCRSLLPSAELPAQIPVGSAV